MIRAALIAAALLVPALAEAQPFRSSDWRKEARPADRARIDGLDAAWREGLREARQGGHAREIKALGALLDPAAGLARPQPTPGAYRCRTIKLGSQGTPALLPYVAYGYFRCRVELTPGGDLNLTKTTGSQRPVGTLLPDGPRRLVFLGSLGLGDDAAPGYGRGRETDLAGVVERVGPNRWRLVIPRPHAESDIDVIELVR